MVAMRSCSTKCSALPVQVWLSPYQVAHGVALAEGIAATLPRLRAAPLPPPAAAIAAEVLIPCNTPHAKQSHRSLPTHTWSLQLHASALVAAHAVLSSIGCKLLAWSPRSLQLPTAGSCRSTPRMAQAAKEAVPDVVSTLAIMKRRQRLLISAEFPLITVLCMVRSGKLNVVGQVVNFIHYPILL